MNTNQKQLKTLWQPISNAQDFSLRVNANLILNEGTRGGGKTDTQLMRFAGQIGRGYGAFWRGVIFDLEYKNLDDLVTKSKRYFNELKYGKFLSSGKDYKWQWPDGEELLFRVAAKEADYWAYHGHEYPFIGWNELTKHPNRKLFDLIASTNRSGFVPEIHTPKWPNRKYKLRGPDGNFIQSDKPLPPIPLTIFATTNPYGKGHNWVKRDFITVAPDRQIVGKKTIVYDAKTKQDIEVVTTQVSIKTSWRDNPFLDAKYIASLGQGSDKGRRAAWYDGSWDITSGGAIDDLWDAAIHVIPRFKIPPNWLIDRAFDWGSTHPFSVGWYAVSNGEEIKMLDGSRRSFAAGSVIRICEWYGRGEADNEGLKLSAREIALGILTRESMLREGGWIQGQVYAGPADNQIRDVRERDVETIETKMAALGVEWTRSEKGSGSRKIGLEIIRGRLEASVDGEGQGLYFMDNCVEAINLLPILPRDVKNLDDVDTNSEDHIYDELRYRLLDTSANHNAKVIAIHPR